MKIKHVLEIILNFNISSFLNFFDCMHIKIIFFTSQSSNWPDLVSPYSKLWYKCAEICNCQWVLFFGATEPQPSLTITSLLFQSDACPQIWLSRLGVFPMMTVLNCSEAVTARFLSAVFQKSSGFSDKLCNWNIYEWFQSHGQHSSPAQICNGKFSGQAQRPWKLNVNGADTGVRNTWRRGMQA